MGRDDVLEENAAILNAVCPVAVYYTLKDYAAKGEITGVRVDHDRRELAFDFWFNGDQQTVCKLGKKMRQAIWDKWTHLNSSVAKTCDGWNKVKAEIGATGEIVALNMLIPPEVRRGERVAAIRGLERQGKRKHNLRDILSRPDWREHVIDGTRTGAAVDIAPIRTALAQVFGPCPDDQLREQFRTLHTTHPALALELEEAL